MLENEEPIVNAERDPDLPCHLNARFVDGLVDSIMNQRCQSLAIQCAMYNSTAHSLVKLNEVVK